MILLSEQSPMIHHLLYKQEWFVHALLDDSCIYLGFLIFIRIVNSNDSK
jgi:hypothetical protein